MSGGSFQPVDWERVGHREAALRRHRKRMWVGLGAAGVMVVGLAAWPILAIFAPLVYCPTEDVQKAATQLAAWPGVGEPEVVDDDCDSLSEPFVSFRVTDPERFKEQLQSSCREREAPISNTALFECTVGSMKGNIVSENLQGEGEFYLE